MYAVACNIQLPFDAAENGLINAYVCKYAYIFMMLHATTGFLLVHAYTVFCFINFRCEILCNCLLSSLRHLFLLKLFIYINTYEHVCMYINICMCMHVHMYV